MGTVGGLRYEESDVAIYVGNSKSIRSGWRVVLGRDAWYKYTYERNEGDSLKLIGNVSKDAQIGALAMTSEGKYVQVVGDYLIPLKTREIAKAVAAAQKEHNPEFLRSITPWSEPCKVSPPPVVIVKKRRVAVMP